MKHLWLAPIALQKSNEGESCFSLGQLQYVHCLKSAVNMKEKKIQGMIDETGGAGEHAGCRRDCLAELGWRPSSASF